MYENIKSLAQELAAHYTFRAEIPYERLWGLLKYYETCTRIVQSNLDKEGSYTCALPERPYGMPTPVDLNVFEQYVNTYLGANLKIVYGITQTVHKNEHEFLIKFARLGVYELTYPRQYTYDDIRWFKCFIDADVTTTDYFINTAIRGRDTPLIEPRYATLNALLRVYVPAGHDDTSTDYLLMVHGVVPGEAYVYDCTQKGTPVWIYVPA